MLTLSGLQPLKTRAAIPHELHPISHCFRRPSLSFSTVSPRNRSNGHRSLCVRALDAAQPYDYESQINERFERSVKLRIAIVGFGNFGQFLAKTLVRQGHTVLAHSRSNYSDIATEIGVSYYSDPHDLCEEHPEVILLCTSIISTESVLKSLPLQRLKRSTLFVDVLSVKEMPRKLFLQNLPPEFDILCTHPMFGPESGKNGWAGLPFVYDKVRIGSEESRVNRCNHFLDVFAQEGCRLVEMSCAEHDRHAAGTQFITHFIGRTLGKIDLDLTPINTKGYETLLNLRDNTSGDSFELFYGLFIYNKNALEQLERLDMAFESVKKQLFGRLHDILRMQLFENAEDLEAPQSSNGAVEESPKRQ
ncbi:arogenate dehydrogenase 2, chloroplastic-like [Macadamia integrifolia]|uniref:arogenate dehydrogenase 2, chloroplastic-like n=1 Tax=Macadamia integrifolia TaxID=60698 RepID=UPI001C528304|nr:arogenate dehydrogenase 2, chloroplastic-like [Macadamia integrifolia]XP_042477113.1 arogenate dehydrogenase 2, chloroplastic-like [Macadamia integrifolia]XP_042477114.1 arogenate dehydrogenase 2, chloroplastic-like [Macadamia integrifolia]XP_042477115.1 arogenate dehydrogenase 2, chloroplastic-like [Macadamia integrifolia]